MSNDVWYLQDPDQIDAAEFSDNTQDVLDGLRERDKLRIDLAAVQQEIQRLRDALAELVELMEDVRTGNYMPDTFTCQPARAALAGAQPQPARPPSGEVCDHGKPANKHCAECQLYRESDALMPGGF